MSRPAITSLAFFSQLRWLDGRNLLDTIEPYRRRIFTAVLDTYRYDGIPQHNFATIGRGKKNAKTLDLCLAGFYCLLFRESPQGSNGYILANDLDQANDDLSLLKRLLETNEILADEMIVLQREIRRRDGRGTLEILPARDVAGSHGKTAAFVGFDEIHSYRNYDLFEALAPDPTRPDSLVWVTSYDTLWTSPGVPLVDFISSCHHVLLPIVRQARGNKVRRKDDQAPEQEHVVPRAATNS
jgi:phage terminase large subunit-like protein